MEKRVYKVVKRNCKRFLRVYEKKKKIIVSA